VSKLLEFGREILNNQPFSLLLGTKLELFEPQEDAVKTAPWKIATVSRRRLPEHPFH